jgi:hypothetical protein
MASIVVKVEANEAKNNFRYAFLSLRLPYRVDRPTAARGYGECLSRPRDLLIPWIENAQGHGTVDPWKCSRGFTRAGTPG